MQGLDARARPITVLHRRPAGIEGVLPRRLTASFGDVADYAAAIGRHPGAPLDPDEAPGYLSGPLPETLPHADGIAAAKQALRDSFPDALRAN
ncbi:hypothetical protein KTN05_07990 [Paracoccus sp. Z118]|uniref:hypothetical protein n=1 Tax=Paracoccus sp. Z118 TaxID=2851017 RepID=UPI001C2BA77F|nr:hypothetical protein [Paracoccus sp. Z118]MBV0891789.1 hypothetical protein [Paracoccus sp. Z118]